MGQPMTTLRAGEIARRTGVSTDTVRYYERRGLLPPVPRRANGYRSYPESAVQRIIVIRRALDAGFSIKELSQILRERDGGGAPCRRVLAIGQERLGDLERRIDQLIALRDDLRALLKDWEARVGRLGRNERAGLLDSLSESPASARVRFPPAGQRSR
jgi:MerR family transcriptional regulator, copper efflux regulator